METCHNRVFNFQPRVIASSAEHMGNEYPDGGITNKYSVQFNSELLRSSVLSLQISVLLPARSQTPSCFCLARKGAFPIQGLKSPTDEDVSGVSTVLQSAHCGAEPWSEEKADVFETVIHVGKHFWRQAYDS